MSLRKSNNYPAKAAHPARLVMAILIVAFFQQPAHAQDVRVERLQQSTAGGVTQGSEFTLFSSLGGTAPSGASENDTFGITSGSRSLLDTIVGLLQLTHAPASDVQRGSNLLVTGSVQGPNLVDTATLHFRRGGSATYSSVPMTESGSGVLQAQIPAEDVTSEGVAYHMEVRDRQGRTIRGPALGDFGVSVSVRAPGLTASEALPGGSEQSAYRLVSVPLDLEAPDPEEVFSDDFGRYDPAEWRFFALAEGQDVIEFPNVDAVQAGEGFWVILREGAQVFDTGPGVTANPVEPFPIALHPGWNLIGDPFDFAVAAGNLFLESQESIELRSFGGSWNDPINEPVTMLEPFTGYAVLNPSESADTLYVDPEPGEAAATAGKTGASTAADLLTWGIRIEAVSSGSIDADNVAGVSRSALEGRDPLDHPEPPTLGSFVSLHFSRPEWEGLTSAYSTDVRAAGIEGGRWDLEVRSGTGEAVHLNFRGVETVPPDFRIWLVDELTGVVTDLRNEPTYSLSDPGSGNVRRLQMIAGTSSYASGLKELELIPEAVVLDPVFPNPVRTSMTIQYGLPEAADVTIRLYSPTGRLVQEIESGRRAEGRHSAVWESSGLSAALANGVYILELRAGGARRVQMITLLR